MERSDGEWFQDVTAEMGLHFVHESGATGEKYLPEIAGSGAALLDFDRDGDLDVYLTTGSHELRADSPAENPRNQLYRNERDGYFVNVTAESGLGDGGYGMGVAVGDIDNDGWVDVYVANYGRDRLYRNTGQGSFEDITAAAGIQVDGWSSSAAFFDYDLDGFLDLYVARYVDFDTRVTAFDEAGRRDYPGPREFPPVSDVLLHNNGDGTFTDVGRPAGISSARAAGLGVVCEDLNSDGLPDIYVANDGYANQLWINRGDGTFSEEAPMLGAALNLHGHAEAGMGVVAADLDGDSDLDLFLTHLAVETNTLYRNLGSGLGFEDASGQSGLGQTSMEYTGFGVAAFDADLDGDLDLAVANGRVKRGPVLGQAGIGPPWDIYAEPNLFYLNDGAGRFTLSCQEAGSLCARVEISRGLAVGDIDSDGDLDLLISNIEGKARLYRNQMPRKGHWLQVRALDPRLKRDALGAKVMVFAGGRQVVRSITSGFSYQSSSEPLAHFGLGPAAKVDRIEVRWPDGLRERFQGGAADRVITLLRGSGSGT